MTKKSQPDMAKTNEAQGRKDTHLDLARQNAALSAQPTGLDRVRLTHNALPECDADAIDASCHFLGYKLAMPLMIGAMTGGTERADRINLHLAEAACEAGVALAVGSQRAALETGRGKSKLREMAKGIPLIGNLGGVQLARAGGIDLAKRAVDAIEADAMAIHLNPLQEITQPEGDRDWRGVETAISTLVASLPCPVIIKEVGAGISANVATRMLAKGVYAIDCAGLGGTNWTRIEAMRRDDNAATHTPFLDWGIPTLDAILALRDAHPQMRLIASGGVRHGLDVARACWLGASVVAAAGPFLKAAEDVSGTPTPEMLTATLNIWQSQVEMALFLTGSPDLTSFRMAEGTIIPDQPVFP